MPLSRLENFLKNVEGNILYVNPTDLDATDSIENQGNSLTKPFKTIQRALLEAGADPNLAAGAEGVPTMTPLKWALVGFGSASDESMLQLLLDWGADLELKSDSWSRQNTALEECLVRINEPGGSISQQRAEHAERAARFLRAAGAKEPSELA